MSPSHAVSPETFPSAEVEHKVLVVDDSATVRRMFWTFLSHRFECHEADSFDDAVAQLRAHEFSVVVTDVIMPGLSGVELLRKVMEEFPGTQVIIASGVDRPQRALDAMRVGAFDYLIKPVDAEVLNITVDRAIAHRDLLLSRALYQQQLEDQNTELVRSKQQLERLQAHVIQHEKMASLGQLAAGVAHELNNPVGFVHANLEILGEYVEKLSAKIEGPGGADADGSSNHLLSEINSIITDCREGADRIRDIVGNLKTFSRLDEAEYKETDVQEGIESTIRLLSRYFSGGNVTLKRAYSDLPLIGAFSSQLNQVWMNLLVNAAQAIGDSHGEVCVSTRHDQDHVYVDIGDNGAGIAVQHLNRVFDPFYTTKPVGEGTGLGLSISFGIVERHGGTISIDSRLGVGTTFSVKLPRFFEPDFGSMEKSIAPVSEQTNYELPYEI